MLRRCLGGIVALIVLAFVSVVFANEARSEDAVYQRAAVAADHPLASEAGVEILKKGGNVVDAGAAVGFALSVLRPASSGLGCGGFMVIWNAQEQCCVTLDYRAASSKTESTAPVTPAKGNQSRRSSPWVEQAESNSCRRSSCVLTIELPIEHFDDDAGHVVLLAVSVGELASRSPQGFENLAGRGVRVRGDRFDDARLAEQVTGRV